MEKTDSKFLKISLIGWCLFDFSNSIPAVIGGIYFAKWFTIDIGAGSILFNLLFFLSGLIIIISGRWVGNRIDTDGYKIWIKFSSVLSISAVAGLFLISQFFSGLILVYLSFILFLLFLFGYQVSRICHNVYLRSVIPFNLQTRMSGLGASANWGGSIVGILLVLPLINYYPGKFGHEITFLAAAIAYGIFTSISLFLMFHSNGINKISISNTEFKIESWKLIITSMGFLLLIYLLLYDSMTTVQRNLPTYLTSVLKMGDNLQSIGFLIILISALFGGLISAKFVNFKNSFTWLKIGSALLGIGIVLITISNVFCLWSAFLIAGISYGILESAIRVNFMSKFSVEMAGRSFGILAIIERTAGIIGPLIWIIPFSFFNEETNSYYFSMLLMALLVFTSLIITLIRNQE